MMRFSRATTAPANCPIGNGRRKWQGGRGKKACARSATCGAHQLASMKLPSSGAALTCIAWLSEGEAEGSRRWEPAKADPWDEDGKLGHLFENGQGGVLYGEPDPASFADIPGIQALCGILSPSGPRRYDMTMPQALRTWGLCVACLQACPDPAGLAWKDRNYFAYVVPGFAGDRPGRGNQLRRPARDSKPTSLRSEQQ